jgi:MerR family transcriptional regulator/heat shock protein HspR
VGVVAPRRATGRGRRYSARDIVVLREVQRLSQEDGVNLAGIKRILELEVEVEALRSRVSELAARLDDAFGALHASRRVFAAGPGGDVVAVPAGRRPARSAFGAGSALVVWRPQR